MIKLCAFADEASSSVKGQIQALQRNGITQLEIRGVGGVNISKISDTTAKDVKKQLDDAGISVWSMGSPIGKHKLADPFEEHLEAHRRIVELADIFDCHHIRMFSFFPTEGECPETTQEQAFARLQILCENTPDSIILCHENEKHIFGETPEACLSIFRSFPRIRAVFDPANFVQCGVDVLSAWEMLKEYVAYLHIKDAIADGTVVPAGHGLGHIAEITAEYLARGGEVMTLEPHLNAFTGLDKLENGESLKPGVTVYKNNDESFDAAVAALKSIVF